MPRRRFPQFSRLPTELRYEIWSFHGLPRGPMLHTISPGRLATSVVMTSVAMDIHNEDYMIDLPTIWASIQVSHEARKVVLAGRELQWFKQDRVLKTRGFTGGVCNIYEKKKRHPSVHNFFFVNWDIDMFYFRRGLQHHIGNLFDEKYTREIKHIAVEVNGPAEARGALHAPSYDEILGDISPFPTSFFRFFLPSVKTVYLAMSFYAVHQICSYMTRRPLDGYDDDMNLQFRGDFDIQMEPEQEIEHKNLIHLWPSGDFGFHHIEASGRYYRNPIRYTPGRMPYLQPQAQGSFEDWVKEMVSQAQIEAEKDLRRFPKFKMVMDHNGSYETLIKGYHRCNVGVVPVNKPCASYQRR
ncbi:hypothetical protein RRF57_000991 [Xylaria bambusicola]|uniref:2EXR domain-containing protein n=1 Tax=Xylaria bambusicola TaxID=326684 RepID=A0AAN7U4C1_9PEZI